jgi:sec-independent protein translocase protein TatC
MEYGAGTDDLSFWEHLGVLRNYILIGGAIFIGFAILSFSYFDDTLIHYLLKPLPERELLFLSPLGPFLFKIKISIYAALVVAFPVWLVLLLHFISPALSVPKRQTLALFALFAVLLGAASLAITYFYFVPTTLLVLQGFVVEGTRSMLTAESYLSFFMLELVVVFFVLQIPIIITALSYVGVVNPYLLGKNRRFAIIGIVTILAVITPTTDIMTLIIVSVPAILLWEVGIAVSKLVHNK